MASLSACRKLLPALLASCRTGPFAATVRHSERSYADAVASTLTPPGSLALRPFSSSRPRCSDDKVSVTFADEKDGSEVTIQAPLGKSLMEIAHDNDVDLECACEGSLACSTCHVIVESQEQFDSLPEATDDENDMLDLAFGLTETSRLGCQIITTPELDGLRVRIPSSTRNFAVDGYVPKPH
ncbi:MFDX1 [Auxenochlorella protothecoides x Auxenochlorella symbiontica]